MRRAALVAGGGVAALLLCVLVALRVGERLWPSRAAAGDGPSIPPARAASSNRGYLHGRVTTLDGVTFEGRLRFRGRRESFWGETFNGTKAENPWAALVPPGRLPREEREISLLGLKLRLGERPQSLRRPFMARYGDLVRIEPQGISRVRVTHKSGTVVDLDRNEAGDFDDGVTVWDAQGTVDLASRRIASVELLPAVEAGGAACRLHGTVHTRQGDFTGFLEWDREKDLASDDLVGSTGGGGLARLRFDGIRTIVRTTGDGSGADARVTLRDGSVVELGDTGDSGVGDVGGDHRGTYVDDARYGRVLVSWDAFESADLDATADSGPAYAEFPPGEKLAGAVTARDGRRLEGVVVFDLDESETTDTLDAPARGVDYSLPFGLVAAIERPPAAAPDAPTTVRLRSGEALALEPSGDLGAGNAGLLVFVPGAPRPEYVPWPDVAAVRFERPAP